MIEAAKQTTVVFTDHAAKTRATSCRSSTQSRKTVLRSPKKNRRRPRSKGKDLDIPEGGKLAKRNPRLTKQKTANYAALESAVRKKSICQFLMMLIANSVNRWN